MRYLMMSVLAGTAVMLAAGCETQETRRNGTLGVPRAEMEQLTDQEFVERAASIDMFEVQASELAAGKDVSAETQAFAEQLIEDHTTVAERLETIAAEQGFSMPEEMLPRHEGLYRQLENLEGPEFERRFWQIQRVAHEEAIDLYERAIEQVDTPGLQTLAEQHLGDLREHYEMALDLEQPADATP